MTKFKKVVAAVSATLVLSTGGYVANDQYFSKVALAINLDNTGKQEVRVKKGTVKEVLDSQGITLSDYDRVSPSLDTQVTEGQEINIYRAHDIIINDGGTTTAQKTTYKTVEDVLKELNITLGVNDKVSPALDKEVASVDTINITRVEKTTETKKETVKFETKEEKDSSLSSGQSVTKIEGKNGEKEVTVETVKENGKVVSETKTAEKVVTEPVAKVVSVGTKVESVAVSTTSTTPTTTSTATQTAVSGRQITVDAVSYSLGYGHDGQWGRGASGMALGPGVKAIAVDPNVIPLGSRVYVPGYGEAIAADTGTAIKGNIIDVFMSRYADSLAWGRKTITITILG